MDAIKEANQYEFKYSTGVRTFPVAVTSESVFDDNHLIRVCSECGFNFSSPSSSASKSMSTSIYISSSARSRSYLSSTGLRNPGHLAAAALYCVSYGF